MNDEIRFNKYDIRGSDYHYREIDTKNKLEFNAYVYARYYIGLEILNKFISKRIHLEENIKILDVGCGDGVLFYLVNKNLNTKNVELYGIDTSEIALKIAQKNNPNGIFKISDVYHLPFNQDYFDIIISSDVIEHITKPKNMLSEVARVGKPNSYTLIGTPIRYTEKPTDKNHYHEFFQMEFKKLLEKYLRNVKLIQSHNLRYLLHYYKRTSVLGCKIMIFRKIINFLSIHFNRNPFLEIKTSHREIYSYMYGIGIIKK